MSTSNEYLTGYQAYDTEDESPEQFLLNDDEAPVHVHINGSNQAVRWNHIENLDDFFCRVYTYHQRHGFFCMLVEDVLQLLQVLFIALFTGFLIECVNYSVLFATITPTDKQTFQDVIIKPCRCGFSYPVVTVCLLVAFGFLFIRLIKVIYNLFKYWEIKQFYRIALNITSEELDNMTWSEILERLMQAQRELQMCIHKNELTQLDIYHRILRYKNYFIALVNKEVLPLRFSLPLIGDFCYLSHGLKANLEMILFWGPCGIPPFENDWHVRNEYKNIHRRLEIAQRLSNSMLLIGVVNLIFSPLVFVWQIIYMFFVYGEIVKREPGFLGSRKWSVYARNYLRHFNELDHELNARLNRAYEPSNDYLKGFSSPLLAIVARFVMFLAGSILVVLVSFTVYDEDTLQIEHMITLMSGCGVVMGLSKVFIPPEHHVFCPETLMTKILAHTHYQPEDWKDKAHTSHVQEQFSQLFQFKAVFLLHELLSPLITPFILIFYLRPKALEIVDFFRNFTVEVLGVGDVCSFAQLDIRKHGSPKWSHAGAANNNPYLQAELGKTELSLMHFALTNPTWQPPTDCQKFLTSIREQAVRDADTTNPLLDNPLEYSLHALAQPMQMSFSQALRMGHSGIMKTSLPNRHVSGALSRHEGPLTQQPISGGIVEALSQSGSYSALVSDAVNHSEYISNEISLSVIYMHELRKRQKLPNIGYENIEDVRQVLHASDELSLTQLHSITEDTSTSSPPTQSHSLTIQ